MTADGMTGDASDGSALPQHGPWLVAIVVAMAAFMEILDTSIANVALPHIAGNLAVSNEESTWVLTSYLVSNAIVLPISGWLAGAIGRKRFFLTCISLFTLSSLLCGFAPSLGLLLLARVLQGLGGGGLQPMAQAILADTFPPQQRGMAFALFGITAIIAPTLGPTLGGWITDAYSWRWIFLINLPVGLLTFTLVRRLISDPPHVSRLVHAGVRIDYIGIGLLAVGVGALQIMLDKGQEEDWFGSGVILVLAVVAAIALVSLLVWEWYSANPIIDLRLFRSRNFLSATLMMFILGVLLFSSLVMMPQFLQTELGYTSERAGLVLSGGAIVMLITMPLVGRLTAQVQARYLVAFGWMCLALAMFYTTTRLDLQVSFVAMTWLSVFQRVGLAFLFVPISLVAYVGLPADANNSVAGLVNFTRNIGSSVGTSLVTTLIARRSMFHQTMLAEHTTSGNVQFQHTMAMLSGRLVQLGSAAHDAQAAAYAMVYRSLQAQATALAYIDTYWLLAVGASVMCAASLLLKKNLGVRS
jgi:MFS transporter, DHA2 family, multidrug resistance protein